MEMRKLILILLLLPSYCFGQSTLPFATIGTRATDTAYTTNTLRFPKYANTDTNKVLSVNERGIVEFRTKGTGGGSGIQWTDTAYFNTMTTRYQSDSNYVSQGAFDAANNSVRLKNKAGENLDEIFLTGFADSLGLDTAKTAIRAEIASGGGTSPEFYGTIYSENTWANLNDFTNNASATVVSGNIEIGSGAGTYTQTLQLNHTTGLERWSATAKIVIDEVDASSFGFGIGVQSTNPHQQYSVLGRVAFFTANSGNSAIDLDIQNNGTWANKYITSRTLHGDVGDTILLTVSRDINVVSVTARNLTDDLFIDTSYTYINDTTMAIALPNRGKFSIFSFGGDFIIDSLAIASEDIKNASVMFVGDSKTVPYNPTSYYYGFPYLVGSKTTSFAVNAGGWDMTADVIAKIPEIIEMAPRTLLLAIGSNDKRAGVTLDSFEARYSRIVTQLEATGIDVIPLLPFYETAQDLGDQKDFIETTYPDHIDTWTPTKWAGSLSADGVHLGTVGNIRVAEKILTSLNLKGATHLLESVPISQSSSTPVTADTPTLEMVTDVGNTTSNSIHISGIGNVNTTNLANMEMLWFNGGWIDAINRGTSTAYPLYIQPSAGGVALGGYFTPTAKLHLAAGGTAASSASLKMTVGDVLGTPEVGAFEFNAFQLYFTQSDGARHNILTTASVNSVSPTAPDRTITVQINGVVYYIHAKTTND